MGLANNQKLGWYVYVTSILFIVTGVVCQKAKLKRDSSVQWHCPGHVGEHQRYWLPTLPALRWSCRHRGIRAKDHSQGWDAWWIWWIWWMVWWRWPKVAKNGQNIRHGGFSILSVEWSLVTPLESWTSDYVGFWTVGSHLDSVISSPEFLEPSRWHAAQGRLLSGPIW